MLVDAVGLTQAVQSAQRRFHIRRVADLRDEPGVLAGSVDLTQAIQSAQRRFHIRRVADLRDKFGMLNLVVGVQNENGARA